MSWFDASGFASLAKSALKEAQKTIDKALDIKDEEQKQSKESSADSTDFFSTWGLKNEDEPAETEVTPQQASIWGSFSGSFFDPSAKMEHPERAPIAEEPRSKEFSSSSSMPEKLVEQTSSSSSTSPPVKKEPRSRRWSSEESGVDEERRTLAKRVRKSNSNSCATHRNSTGSDRRSLESVEVLGSESSSIDTCASSVHLKINSDSVEILPDGSATSPSSVEVLDDCQSDSYLSPMEHRDFEEDEASPTMEESATLNEVQELRKLEGDVQEDAEELEEASLAEDSYISACEVTGATILESANCEDKSNDQQFSGSLSDYSLNLESLSERQAESAKKKKELGESFGQPKMIEPSEVEGNDFLISTDSSCDGTLIGSSSEDNAAPSKVAEAPLTSSSYVKTMLADAMSERSESQDPEKQEVPRENSPISSER